MKKHLIVLAFALSPVAGYAAPNPFSNSQSQSSEQVPEVPGSGRAAAKEQGPERPDSDGLRVSAIVGRIAVMTTGSQMMAVQDGSMIALPEGEFRAIINDQLQSVSLLDVESGEMVWQSSVGAYVIDEVSEEVEDRSVSHAQLLKSLEDSAPDGTSGIGSGSGNEDNSNGNSNSTSSSGF